MIIKQDLVKRIKEYFDLNIYETRVWLALLSRGIASAGEIAQISAVPRSRTYDVLESLEKRGFAIVKIGKPVKYIAVKPVEVLEKMKMGAMQEAQEKVKTLTVLKETSEYEELEKLHKTGINPIKSHDITGSIKGRSNIMAKLRDLISNAKKEITISTSAADFDDKSRVLLPALEEAAKNNIKIKLALIGQPEKLKRLNGKLNTKPMNATSDARMYIADKNEVLFMITGDNSDEEVAVWLNSPFFVQSVSTMIDATMQKSSNGIK